jgi:hypothetical protein
LANFYSSACSVLFIFSIQRKHSAVEWHHYIIILFEKKKKLSSNKKDTFSVLLNIILSYSYYFFFVNGCFSPSINYILFIFCVCTKVAANNWLCLKWCLLCANKPLVCVGWTDSNWITFWFAILCCSTRQGCGPRLAHPVFHRKQGHAITGNLFARCF